MLMMRGRLVIASVIGGLVEVVRTAGIVCPPGDVEPLAACMSAVIAHPERTAALGARRECVLSTFGYTRMLEVHAQGDRRATSKRRV
jgi:glycosyltransferase involved in cell wall biosynthesis